MGLDNLKVGGGGWDVLKEGFSKMSLYFYALNLFILMMHQCIIFQYPRSFLIHIMDRAFGPIGCLVFYTLREMLQFAAVNHLVTLSFER